MSLSLFFNARRNGNSCREGGRQELGQTNFKFETSTSKFKFGSEINARDYMHVPVVIQGERSISINPSNGHTRGHWQTTLFSVTTKSSLQCLIACLVQFVFHFLEGSADILAMNPRTRGTFLALTMIYQIVSKTGSRTTVCITCPFPLPEAHLQVVVSPNSGGTLVLLLCY